MNLKDYLNENGIQKTWFAKKIGIKPSYLVGFLAGRNNMAVKHWVSIVRLSQNQVTYDDLIRSHNAYETDRSTEEFKTKKKQLEDIIKKSRKSKNRSQLPSRQSQEQKQSVGRARKSAY